MHALQELSHFVLYVQGSYDATLHRRSATWVSEEAAFSSPNRGRFFVKNDQSRDLAVSPALGPDPQGVKADETRFPPAAASCRSSHVGEEGKVSDRLLLI